MPTYLLGIDAGTSVIKSILFDADGRELFGVGREIALLHPAETHVEQEMIAVWQTVVATVQQLIADAGCPPASIAAIGVTGQGDGTWLVDAEHKPLRNAITWLDGRTGDFAGQAQSNGLSQDYFAITGTALNTSNQALHLRWLQEHEPALLQAASAALRAKDWIFLQLTGVVSTDESDASHTYFSVQSRRYDPAVLELLGIVHLRHLLPPARPAAENRAPLLSGVAVQLGLTPGTPVVAGPFDVAAADLGAGVINPGDACTILGTAGIHQVVIAEPVAQPENQGYTMCHAPANRLVRLLPTMTGVLNLQWFVQEFFAGEVAAAEREGRSSWLELEELANNVALGSEGILYHPYIDPAGERSPFVRPDARAQFSGLRLGHRRATLLRAVYEGVVLSAMDCYDHLGVRLTTLTLAGGGARSAFWAQMFADALGCQVQVMAGTEFGAKGAALNAGVAVGVYDSYAAAVARTVTPERSFRPDLANTVLYRKLLSLYRETYQAMFPVWERRAALWS